MNQSNSFLKYCIHTIVHNRIHIQWLLWSCKSVRSLKFWINFHKKIHWLCKFYTIESVLFHSYTHLFLTVCPIPACGRVMTWIRFRNAQTSHCWRCPTHHGQKMTPRVGSFFESSKLPLRKIVGLLWCWAKDMPNNRTMEMTGVSKKHVISWFKVKAL